MTAWTGQTTTYVTIDCRECRAEIAVPLGTDDWVRYKQGGGMPVLFPPAWVANQLERAEGAFPYLTQGEREFLVTEVCTACRTRKVWAVETTYCDGRVTYDTERQTERGMRDLAASMVGYTWTHVCRVIVGGLGTWERHSPCRSVECDNN